MRNNRRAKFVRNPLAYNLINVKFVEKFSISRGIIGGGENDGECLKTSAINIGWSKPAHRCHQRKRRKPEIVEKLLPSEINGFIGNQHHETSALSNEISAYMKRPCHILTIEND